MDNFQKYVITGFVAAFLTIIAFGLVFTDQAGAQDTCTQNSSGEEVCEPPTIEELTILDQQFDYSHENTPTTLPAVTPQPVQGDLSSGPDITVPAPSTTTIPETDIGDPVTITAAPPAELAMTGRGLTVGLAVMAFGAMCFGLALVMAGDDRR